MKFTLSDAGGGSAGFSSVPAEMMAAGESVRQVASGVTAARGRGIAAQGYGSYVQVQQALSSRAGEWQQQLADWEKALDALGRTAYWSGNEIARNDEHRSDAWRNEHFLREMRR